VQAYWDIENYELILISQDALEQKIGEALCLPWEKVVSQIGPENYRLGKKLF